MAFNLVGSRLIPRFPRYQSIALRTSLLQLKLPVTDNSCKQFHVNTVDHKKMGNFAKYARVTREKRETAKAAYERLDPEDRPTGCILCQNPDVDVTYLNVRLLSQFVSPHTGRIYGTRVTGLCEKKQNEVRAAIERARQFGLMPVTMKYFDFHGDPKLF